MADTFAEIAIRVRKALAVSTTYDTDLEDAVKDGAQTLLRNYNFPKSVVHGEYLLDNPSTGVQLEIDTGKVLHVRLSVVEDGETLYKILRRREPSALPTGEEGPQFWYQLGEELRFDRALEEDDYTLDVWYLSTDPIANEGWLCNNFADVLFHSGCFNGCPLVGKPDLMGLWQPLMQRDEIGLAIFLNELEFNDLDLRMGNTMVGTFEDRYRAN